MERIDAYLTEDNTLFRVKAEAEKYEEKKRLRKKLYRVLYLPIETGDDFCNFIDANPDLVMEILAVNDDFMARWQAENK